MEKRTREKRRMMKQALRDSLSRSAFMLSLAIEIWIVKIKQKSEPITDWYEVRIFMLWYEWRYRTFQKIP